MDNINIASQLENLGMHITLCRVNHICAIYDTNLTTIIIEISYDEGFYIMSVKVDIEINFKAIIYDKSSFDVNYALALYHIKYHIDTLKKDKYERR